MLNRIVVAYDGSQESRAAYDAAFMLAKAARVGIVAAYVLEPTVADMLALNPGMAMDPLAPPAMAPIIIDENGRPPQKITEDLAAFERESRGAGVPFESKIGHGTLVDWLMRESRPGDMLALGLKGRFARSGVGSTTRSLARQAPCPVLVVKDRIGPVGSVLVAFDATGAAEAALRFASGLSVQTGWPMTVLAMARGGVGLGESEAWAVKAAPDGTRVVAIGGDAAGGEERWEADLLERAAGANGAALLVMGAYADSALRDLLMGSTTQHVLSKLGGAAVLVHGTAP